jgi:hypothetical protein
MAKHNFLIECNAIQAKSIIDLDVDELTSLMVEATPAVDVKESSFIGFDTKGRFIFEFTDKNDTGTRYIYGTFKDGSLTGSLE